MELTRRQFIESLVSSALLPSSLIAGEKKYSDLLLSIVSVKREPSNKLALMNWPCTIEDEIRLRAAIAKEQGRRYEKKSMDAAIHCAPETNRLLAGGYMQYCRDIAGFISRQLRISPPYKRISILEDKIVPEKGIGAYIVFSAEKKLTGRFLSLESKICNDVTAAVCWDSSAELRRRAEKEEGGYVVHLPSITFWQTNTSNMAELLSRPAVDTLRFIFMAQTTRFLLAQDAYSLSNLFQEADELEISTSEKMGRALTQIFVREYLPGLSDRYDMDLKSLGNSPGTQKGRVYL